MPTEDARIQQAEARLASHGEQIDDLKDCITRLTVLMETTAATQADHEERLRTIESKNGQAWEKAVWLVVAALIGAALAMFSQQLGV